MNYSTRLTTHHIQKITVSKIHAEDTYNSRTITIYGKDDDGDLIEVLEVTLFGDELDNLKVDI